MSPEWGSLPLLPLRCVLDHLSTEDALAAMSTCRHWRTAMLLYEGRKDTLSLRAKKLEKNLFVLRIFRRHIKKLHIYIDCKEHELEKFMDFVLPQFFDTVSLQELVFIGPSYLKQKQNVPFVKLKRIITESLVFKHSHSLQKLAFMGCEFAAVKTENDVYNKHVEKYSMSLSFGGELAADAILTSANASLMVFSAIKHIIVDYEQVNTAALETLASLPRLSQISLNVLEGRALARSPPDWHRVHRAFPHTLRVALNIIGVPHRRFKEIVENVLVDGMALTSLKVLFCKTMSVPILNRLIELYQSSLVELVWADSPQDPNGPYQCPARPSGRLDNFAHVNPLIILCWRCAELKRLVVHGYWVWQYDLLGMVRLRKKLNDLEVSSIYTREDRLRDRLSEDGTVRVMSYEAPMPVDSDFVREVNQYTEFNWKPLARARLHPALRARGTAAQRAHYALLEAARALVLPEPV